MRVWVIVVLVASLAGCEYRQEFSSEQDAGEEQDAGQADTTPPIERDATIIEPDGGLPYRACSSEPPPTLTDPIVAVWEGYFEEALYSGADGVTIVLRSENGTDYTGTVVFGSAAPPPPPANSNECMPANFEWNMGLMAMPWYPIEGHEYRVVTASSSALRLQVSISEYAPWTDWCACQVPVPTSPEGGWTCLPFVGGHATPDGHCFIDDYQAGTSIEYACCKHSLCLANNACVCDAERCAVSTDTRVSFDLSVNGDRADGTVDKWQLGGVHLLRTQ